MALGSIAGTITEAVIGQACGRAGVLGMFETQKTAGSAPCSTRRRRPLAFQEMREISALRETQIAYFPH
jgi:hypothetical protein